MNQIKLIFPCKVDWETMPHQEAGRYCDECKKRIHDYTSAKADEFTTSSVFCGQFRSDQLTYHKSEYEIRNFKTISLSLLTLLGAVIPAQQAKAQAEETTTEVTVGKFSNLKFPLKMEGTIRDKESREIIVGATVTLMQLNSVISTIKTDSSGCFSFLLLERDIKDSVIDVRVSYQGTNRYYAADTLLRIPLILDAIKSNAVFSIDFLIKPAESLPLITTTTFVLGQGYDIGRPYVPTGGVVAIQPYWVVNPFVLTDVTPTLVVDTAKPKVMEAKFEPQPKTKKVQRKTEVETADPKTNRILVALITFIVFLIFRFNKFKR